jgi:two-component system chemotaxis response regulator CheB
MKNIIAIGASAGGLDPLCRLIGDLPADFPAAVFVVVHMGAQAKSYLAEILGRETGLAAQQARDGDPIEHGHVYTARPSYDLRVGEERMTLTQGKRVQQNRPSANVLFASAAERHGRHVTGVLLSGMLSDGCAGFNAIRLAGGTTVVQHPWEARYSSMPGTALDRGLADHCVSVRDMASLLGTLARERPAQGPLGGGAVPPPLPPTTQQ